MSAGIIVMNENGLALAADSAVTDSQGKTSYNANKLFKMSEVNPVGAIVYENAEFMKTPIGDIIAQYVRDRGNQSFPTLKEQVVDFLAYLEASPTLRAKEKDHVLAICQRVVDKFQSLATKKFDAFIEKHGKDTPPNLPAIGKKALVELYKEIDGTPPLIGLNEETTSFSEVVSDNDIAKVIPNDVSAFLSDDYLELFKSIICDSFDKCWHTTDWSWTGIAFAGYGCNAMPQLYLLILYGIVQGKVQYSRWEHYSIRETPFVIQPLAQTDVINTFLTGMNPNLINADGAAMPVEDMASFAETMINITSLRRKWVNDEKYGTVGGPTDVAMITKEKGFVWVKSKQDSDTAQDS